MIFGIGVDIVEIERIKKIILRTPLFLDRVFTKDEQNYCHKKAEKYKSFAVRFAAKEAFFKALGTGINGFSFTDIEVKSSANGNPFIEVYGEVKIFCEKEGIKKIDVSLSHSDNNAIAFIVLSMMEV